MSLVELLPKMRELSRADKVLLLVELRGELERAETIARLCESPQTFEIWSQYATEEVAAEAREAMARLRKTE